MTIAPLEKSGSSSFSIPEIVSAAEVGRIRVPTFQRQFVWNAGDVRNLFDSLYRGFPVGTLLLWTRHSPAGRVQLGPIEFDTEERSDALWVVDGQQRITSLFAALTKKFEIEDTRFRVNFDLTTQKFVTPRKGVINPRQIPVREAMETRTLQAWLRNHWDELTPEDYDTADQLVGQLRDYRIPAYIVNEEDQALLREVFDRVNSAGKPISRAQVFHALFGGEADLASPAAVVSALEDLNFGTLEENRIVQSVLALRGGDVQRDIHDEFRGGEDPADWFDKTEEALRLAINFLRAEGVLHIRLMPNTLPLPVLAAFFHLHPTPEPWILRLLSRWLWRGWVHGFGREGGQTPVLRRAIRSVNPDYRNPQNAPSPFEAVKSLLEFTPDRAVPDFNLQALYTKGANGRLIVLALASLGPLDNQGQKIDLATELEDKGIDALTEFVRNNRSRAGARGFWQSSSPPITAVSDKSILCSHAITPLALEALESGDKERFMSLREEEINPLVHNFLDSRLEPNAPIRPPLSELIELATAEEDD
ncbi:DUF262 domain-containing protein [Actinomadura syzygii]|uniref:DUF262 domain-containing protein n=1 Tax=Actinomadura syzygii TaxID=1427538 RepID=A0A5D0U1L4_9ACTN|nr:DUF262 domain-containing protein [Actinomadura syzygii]TYC11545.1 DUF262 domain-containing protein [Actinomadura syzygii]